MLKYITGAYCLFLSLGALYLGISMLLGKGIFADFPPEWIGVMPFSSWDTLALFGIIVFGIGNAAAGVYGIRKNAKVFVLALVLGAFCFLCAALPIMLLGEGYLPLVYLFLASALQMILGTFGLIAGRKRKYSAKISSGEEDLSKS